MGIYCNKDDVDNSFHSRLYSDFVNDYRYNDKYPFVRYTEEYNGQEVIKLCCSQHSKVVDCVETISDYQRKKITESWVKFLKEEQLPIREVQVCTRMSQDVFDALCSQRTIESLRIKEFTGCDISQISKLKNLKKLFIESATGLESVAPIASLDNLEVLILGGTKKVTDYSELGMLKKVNVFGICKYQTGYGGSMLSMADDSFMKDMTALNYIDMCDVKIENQVFLKPENVKNMEFVMFNY